MANILKLASHLTFETVESERQRILDNFSHSQGQLTLDLIDVKLCDSAGLALLIELRRVVHQLKRRIYFNNISEGILSLAKFCGVEKLLL